MARCPFAAWRPISGSSGAHKSGPYKIVHHTTEGQTAQGAFDAFAAKRADPHFTVDANGIYQHVDTAEGARALRNDPNVGGETNRDSAVQIELVGFAHLPKDPRALRNVARLCRWIEATHGVPRIWPAGLPKPARNGKDPGGHNRDAAIWDTQGGHYGHCHVPENTHWDPGYTQAEAQFVLDATFDGTGKLLSPAQPMAAAKAAIAAKSARRGAVPAPRSTMPDHHDVPRGVGAYLRSLRVATTAAPAVTATRAGKAAAKKAPVRRAMISADAAQASVNAGSLVCFVDGLSRQEQEDVLFSVQLAQRGASGEFDRFTQQRKWYEKYVEILQNVGWTSEQMSFAAKDQGEGEFRMDKAALAVIAAIATQNQLAVLQQAVSSLEQLAEDDGTISLFDFQSSVEGSGNFQLGAVQKSGKDGPLTMALGSFYFHAADEQRRFLFFKWGARDVNFWASAQRMTLNMNFYARYRDDVIAALADRRDYIRGLKLGGR